MKKTHREPFSPNKFFIGDTLYTPIRVHRAKGLIEAWNFTECRREIVLYSDRYKVQNRAYSLFQMEPLLNRKTRTILLAFNKEGAPTPPGYYWNWKRWPERPDKSDPNVPNVRGSWYGNERYVLDMWEFFVDRGRSNVSDDALLPAHIYPPMPTKAEMLAIMHRAEQFYVKDKDGNMVPTWQAPEF